MSWTSATRRLQFCCGHRVHRHESKCRHLHGHNYVVLLTAVAPTLDDLGRVIDFAVLKDRFGRWLEKYWDHGFVLWEEDEEARRAVGQVPEQKIYLLPANPTAENMAFHLLHEIGPELLQGTGVRLRKVVLWETENCYAEVVQEMAPVDPTVDLGRSPTTAEFLRRTEHI